MQTFRGAIANDDQKISRGIEELATKLSQAGSAKGRKIAVMVAQPKVGQNYISGEWPAESMR